MVPRIQQLASLARAWFPEAEWAREPEQPRARQAAVGARFRGITPEGPAALGELRLTWAAHLEGPLGADELAEHGIAQPPSGAVLRLRLTTGSPHDPRLLAWMRAAARRAGGAVLFAGGAVERPDPALAIELSVFSAVPVAPEVTFGLVHAVVPSARVSSAPEPDEGIAPYTIEIPTQFDGSVELRFARAGELPVCLLSLDWREYGPFAYRVAWVPPAELAESRDPALERVVKARLRPVVARVAHAMQRAAGGSVVDEDGFVVTHDELVARAVAV